ncbi:MAG TPA: ATP-binding protein, partial [Chitinophagaceae bacterium]|nr:ATP-binding protein [Chitinophagaceae bacterium]
VDCNALVNDVLADLGSAISETQTKIEITGTLPVINAYRTELKQVFQNLIINAIKFRKKDAIPHIKVLSQKKDGFWQFTVSDNGIGIDPKHNEKIFVIFQRLHTREEYEGSGIGLSHCRKIAELHKGKIWVDSAPGKGSAFHFTIHQSLS